MDHIVPVTVVDAGDNLLEEPPGVLLLQLAVLHNVVKQLSTFMVKIQLLVTVTDPSYGCYRPDTYSITMKMSVGVLMTW